MDKLLLFSQQHMSKIKLVLSVTSCCDLLIDLIQRVSTIYSASVTHKLTKQFSFSLHKDINKACLTSRCTRVWLLLGKWRATCRRKHSNPDMKRTSKLISMCTRKHFSSMHTAPLANHTCGGCHYVTRVGIPGPMSRGVGYPRSHVCGGARWGGGVGYPLDIPTSQKGPDTRHTHPLYPPE